ncbi:hypothetical protein ACT9NR_17185 (plasmid) [Natrialba aegyptia]
MTTPAFIPTGRYFRARNRAEPVYTELLPHAYDLPPQDDGAAR